MCSSVCGLCRDSLDQNVSFEHVGVKSRVIVKRIFESGKHMQPYTEGSLTVPIIQRMLLPVLEDVV